MFDKRKHRSAFILLSAIFIVLVICLYYSRKYSKSEELVITSDVNRIYFDERDLSRNYEFDVEEDVLVFLHIQKTGGTTFGRHLVLDLETESPCKCDYSINKNGKIHMKDLCNCHDMNRNVWLFSRYSTGWRCGLHADWTELKDCVEPYIRSHSNHMNRNRR